MNFLSKTLSSFTGPSIPYNFGEVYTPSSSNPQSIWKQYQGTRKDDGAPCTVFQWDKNGSNADLLALNGLRKIRSMRLPGILKVFDTFETDSVLFIMCERVIPLIDVIRTIEVSDQLLLLVVYSVAKALKFINVEGSSVLGQLNFNNVFVNDSGEIRLGGFEVLTNLKSDPDQPIYRLSSALPGFNNCLPPEVSTEGVEALRRGNGTGAVKFDSWIFGVFIYRLFNDGVDYVTPADLQKATNIPKIILTAFKKLTNPSITTRATTEQFLRNGENTYFNTDLIQLFKTLDEFNLKSDDEKIQFFEILEPLKDDTPPGFLENRIVPELITFFTQSPQNAAFALKYILSYSENLPKPAFQKTIKPVIIKAFALPDRQIRVLLLGYLPKFIENLDKSDISDKIFNNFVTGFSDSSPALREETIKATLALAPKLSERQLNNELLRFLAKTQADEKPEIRTNTTICLGKLAEFMNKSSRPNVLATAFGKALKDPFIHSRLAAIKSLCSCLDYFTPEIIANKILTVIAPSLLDKSSKVRDEAQMAFDLFFQKIKLEAQKLPIDPETSATDDDMNAVNEGIQNFGLMNSAISRFTAGFGGAMNTDLANSNESSRASSPSVISSFNKPPKTYSPVEQTLPSDKTKKPDFADSWGNDDDIEIDDDDGWNVQEEEETPVFGGVAPKVTGLATESKSSQKPVIKKTTSTTLKTKTTSKPTGKGMQLKATSKSKLKLEIDDDEDGWGDGW